MKKVLVIHNRYLQRGGEDTVVDEEYEILKTFNDVDLFETSSESLPKSPVSAAALSMWNESERKRLIHKIDKFTPDILHFHNMFPYLSKSVLWNGRNIPSVVTLHNFRDICINGLFMRDGSICTECLGKTPVNGIIHRCYRGEVAASAVVAVSSMFHNFINTGKNVKKYISLNKFSKEIFLRAGIPEEKIVVKPNSSVDYGIGGGEGDYAVFVGRISQEKGVDILIKAWMLANPRGQLYIIGDGPLLQTFSDDMHNINWMGRLDKHEVIRIIKGARFMIWPSRVYETSGLTMIESMSCGTPVLASRQGASLEIIRERENGSFFTTGDYNGLAELINLYFGDRLNLSEMRKNARKTYLDSYTQEKNCASLQRIYESL